MLQQSCVQPEVTILHLGVGPSSVEELKDIAMHFFFFFFLSRNQNPVSRLYHHLIVPLFLYPLPSRISNCLNLLFETIGASLVAQLVKNPPAMQETWVQPLDWEDPLEKGMATHSRIPA